MGATPGELASRGVTDRRRGFSRVPDVDGGVLAGQGVGHLVATPWSRTAQPPSARSGSGPRRAGGPGRPPPTRTTRGGSTRRRARPTRRGQRGQLGQGLGGHHTDQVDVRGIGGGEFGGEEERRHPGCRRRRPRRRPSGPTKVRRARRASSTLRPALGPARKARGPASRSPGSRGDNGVALAQQELGVDPLGPEADLGVAPLVGGVVGGESPCGASTARDRSPGSCGVVSTAWPGTSPPGGACSRHCPTAVAAGRAQGRVNREHAIVEPSGAVLPAVADAIGSAWVGPGRLLVVRLDFSLALLDVDTAEEAVSAPPLDIVAAEVGGGRRRRPSGVVRRARPGAGPVVDIVAARDPTLDLGHRTSSVVVLVGGRIAVIDDRGVVVIDESTGAVRAGPLPGVAQLVPGPDGTLVVGREDGTVRVVDAASLAPQGPGRSWGLRIGYGRWTSAPTGRLVVQSGDDLVQLVDLDARELVGGRVGRPVGIAFGRADDRPPPRRAGTGVAHRRGHCQVVAGSRRLASGRLRPGRPRIHPRRSVPLRGARAGRGRHLFGVLTVRSTRAEANGYVLSHG